MTRRTDIPDLQNMNAIMNRITIAGCLAMVFLHTFMGAQLTAFLRDLGANAFHFGIVGAIGPMMLGLQFFSALFINRLTRRKRFWIWLMSIRRASICLPVLLPWFMPNASPTLLVWTFLAIYGAGMAMGTFGGPIFFGWMGDLLPDGKVTEFWASRQKWLSWSQAGVMLAVSLYFFAFRDTDIRTTYMLVVFLSAAVGVLDILLFMRIPEPAPALSPSPALARFLAPFKEKRFLRLILFTCVLNFGTMMAAPFFTL